jgi:hypothetical protein
MVGTGARHGIVVESFGADRIKIGKARSCGCMPNPNANAFNMKRIA